MSNAPREIVLEKYEEVLCVKRELSDRLGKYGTVAVVYILNWETNTVRKDMLRQYEQTNELKKLLKLAEVTDGLIKSSLLVSKQYK